MMFIEVCIDEVSKRRLASTIDLATMKWQGVEEQFVLVGVLFAMVPWPCGVARTIYSFRTVLTYLTDVYNVLDLWSALSAL